MGYNVAAYSLLLQSALLQMVVVTGVTDRQYDVKMEWV